MDVGSFPVDYSMVHILQAVRIHLESSAPATMDNQTNRICNPIACMLTDIVLGNDNPQDSLFVDMHCIVYGIGLHRTEWRHSELPGLSQALLHLSRMIADWKAMKCCLNRRLLCINPF